MEFFVEVWRVTCELAPWLLFGALLAGVLHVLLPPGLLQRQLRGPGGVVKAVALGVPLPLCSCSVVPVGLSLKTQGAGVGATVGFLISTPQTGVDSLLVTGSMLGWPFAAFKVVLALVTGLVGGLAAGAASPPPPMMLDVLSSAGVGAESKPWWRRAIEHADTVLGSIWKWLVFGVLAAAALSTWLPPAALTGVASQGVVAAMAITLVASLPLYVCATASVPIAAALESGGLPMAAVLVFLMAGPATNAATLAALFRGIGPRATGIYLATIIVGSLLGGWLLDRFMPPLTTPPPHEHDHAEHTAAWWATAAAAMLIAWLASLATRELRPRDPLAESH